MDSKERQRLRARAQELNNITTVVDTASITEIAKDYVTLVDLLEYLVEESEMTIAQESVTKRDPMISRYQFAMKALIRLIEPIMEAGGNNEELRTEL